MSIRIVCDNPSCTHGDGGTPKVVELASVPPPFKWLKLPEGWLCKARFDPDTHMPLRDPSGKPEADYFCSTDCAGS